MDNNPNNIEFSIKRKTDGKIILMRLGIIAVCYTPFVILAAVLFKMVFVAIPIFFVAFTYAAWFFMRFTQIEYEYSIISGEFAVAAIYNNLQRKTLIAAKIKDMSAVIPYEYNKNYLDNSIKKIFYYCSDLDFENTKNKDLYICIFNDEKYGKCAVVFNAARKFVQMMKFYNSQNVIVKDSFWI